MLSLFENVEVLDHSRADGAEELNDPEIIDIK